MTADAGHTDPDPSRGQVGGRDLPVAIIVGVLLAVVFLGTLFWDALAFTVVVVVLVSLAYVESGRVLSGVDRRLLVPVLVPASLVMLVGTYLAGPSGQAVGVAVLLLGAMLWQLADRGRSRSVETVGLTALFGLWVGLFASYAVLLVALPGGPVLVLAVIGSAALTDIGGYVVGVNLGKHKIAPRISPNKSLEGLIGGLVVAVVLTAAVLPLLGDELSAGRAAALALTCGVASFLGDLAESMVKRDLGVKDLGGLLPGHGGVLDRVDGILFALPVGYHVLLLLA